MQVKFMTIIMNIYVIHEGQVYDNFYEYVCDTRRSSL